MHTKIYVGRYKADFYLPKHRIFIEFAGMMNYPGYKEHQVKKQVIYHRWQIIVLWVTPENLNSEYIINGIKEMIKKQELKQIRMDKAFSG